jgi:hypothetical protein
VSDRVRIGTCANPADAALVRSVFAAFGIDVLIAAEHHASLLGGVGSNFLSLDIWVDAADAEEAAALLHDLREPGGAARARANGTEGEAEGEGEADAASDAGDDAADGEPGDPADAGPDGTDLSDDVRRRTRRRQRAGVAMLLGCCLTFGAAHMVMGAWRRGIALAVLEVCGFLQIVHRGGFGPLLVVVAIVADLVGTLVMIRDAHRVQIPEARVRRP